MLRRFDTLFFLIGFALGIFWVYITDPPKKILIKHPTPQNAGKIVYKDKVSNCYKFKSEEITCPNDPEQILEHPVIVD